MSIEVIKTFGLRGLGILFVLAGAALLVPSLDPMTGKRSKTREHVATYHEPPAACLPSDARREDCRRAARMEHGAN
jgi:hypothetical protein